MLFFCIIVDDRTGLFLAICSDYAGGARYHGIIIEKLRIHQYITEPVLSAYTACRFAAPIRW